MRNEYKKAKAKAIIQKKYDAYQVIWICNNGHRNFDTVLSTGTQHDICIKCREHYEYEILK